MLDVRDEHDGSGLADGRITKLKMALVKSNRAELKT